jgi:Rap1a immunity proteins
MKRTAMVAILSALAGTGQAANDGPFTAADLNALCQAGAGTAQSMCNTYIMGVAEGIREGMAIAAGKYPGARTPCIPTMTPDAARMLSSKIQEQLRDVLREYPGDGNNSAPSAIGAALIASYGCRK